MLTNMVQCTYKLLEKVWKVIWGNTEGHLQNMYTSSCLMPYSPRDASVREPASHLPPVSHTCPPASLTMRWPAAMSHTWMPHVTWASAFPRATWHMLRAADPGHRRLGQQGDRGGASITWWLLATWPQLTSCLCNYSHNSPMQENGCDIYQKRKRMSHPSPWHNKSEKLVVLKGSGFRFQGVVETDIQVCLTFWQSQILVLLPIWVHVWLDYLFNPALSGTAFSFT